ncbi:MAG: hypothetical protein ACI7YS_12545 [Flavobacterium sp.]
MNLPLFSYRHKAFFLFLFLVFSYPFYGQGDTLPKPKSDFWRHVQYGGGVALNFGSEFTNITLAPSAIYNFNNQFALGTGLQYSYYDQKHLYTSNVYGISFIGLYTPISFLQLSLELEEVNANNTYQDITGVYKDNFWVTGLFTGIGYRSQNVTLGGRFNLLFNKDKDIYGDSFMPFVRVYF